MRIIHRIGLRIKGSELHALEALNVKIDIGMQMPGEVNPLVTFDVAEDDPHWPEIHSLLQQWQVSDFVRTEFSKKEIQSAQWLKMNAWHHGYPQPDDGAFGYLKATYDLSNACEKCGIGKRQRAPFQMKGEPKWGRRGILQLIWVYDEVFVAPEVWKEVFEPYGIRCGKVTNTKGAELQTVVQLIVDEQISIRTEGLAAEECPKCGRKKYSPIVRGPFPPLATEPKGAMVKTNEYFGSGGQLDRAILISQDIANALSSHNVRGAELKPVKN